MWRAKVPFVSMWRTVLSMYAAAGVDREALKLYVNQRQAFHDAFFDSITLLDIDYSESFRCTCSPPDGVAAADHEPTELIGDGISLGYRADLSYFVSPWKVDTVARLKTGSLHQNRTFVTDPQIRSALLQFAQHPGKAGAGLSENELEVLRVSLPNSKAKRLCHLLESPQLRQDKFFFCNEHSVEFLRAASGPQAAAILLPQAVEPIIEDLISSKHRHFTDLDQVRKLAERASRAWTILAKPAGSSGQPFERRRLLPSTRSACRLSEVLHRGANRGIQEAQEEKARCLFKWRKLCR
jgi:hypothetical protein